MRTETLWKACVVAVLELAEFEQPGGIVEIVRHEQRVDLGVRRKDVLFGAQLGLALRPLPLPFGDRIPLGFGLGFPLGTQPRLPLQAFLLGALPRRLGLPLRVGFGAHHFR